jgi:hypothetical protein
MRRLGNATETFLLATPPDLLCFVAASWDMNPPMSKEFLDAERQHDPEYFDREYGAVFADSITSAFSMEAVEACVVSGRFELPYCSQYRYAAGVDPSGGGADEFSLSICHCEKERIAQDCIRAVRSRRPEDVVSEFSQTLKSYHLSAVIGDRSAAVLGLPVLIVSPSSTSELEAVAVPSLI